MTLDGNGALDLDAPAGRLTVYTGLSIEARAVRGALPDSDVRVTGMGARRPARRTARGPARRPNRLRGTRPSRHRATTPAPQVGETPAPVAVAGFCGALDRGLSAGDVVVATEVRGPGGVVRCPSAPFLVAALRAIGIEAQAGPIVTSDHIVHGAERDRLRDTGAIAVDMESAAIAQAAGGAPFAVVRVVSDTPSRGLARPSLLTDGLRGLRTLRRASAVLAAWAAAAGDREALLAGPRSFCAGVERAIEIVERALDRYGAPVYVRKQIVHNAHVVQRLERMGAVFVDELDDVPDGATTVFSAHGVSPQVREEAGRRHLDVIDATCPLVSKVHAEARRFADRGDTVVLIGHAGHEEVEGTLGEAPGKTILVGDAADVATVDLPDPSRVSYVMQTTLAVDEAAGVVDALRERFPDLSGPNSDDICYATTNRQDAVRAIAANADVVLVVGSANSSNSQRLVEISQRMGVPAYLVDDASYVEPAWLAGRRNVGITAGASAPQDLVDQLVEALRGLGSVTVTERTVANESVSFTLPKEVN